MSEVNNLLT